jgi:protein-disulfide isomerase
MIALIFDQALFAADSRRNALAEVDGVPISSEEVEKPLGSQLSKLEEQIYALKRQKLDALINDKLLEKEAAKRKLTVPQLIDAEVTSKVSLVTEQEIEKFYQDNKAQIKGDDPQVREKIRGFLQNQKLAAKRAEFLTSLRSQAKIVDNLKPPPIARVEVSVDGAPFKGPVNAPVTIVEFSDFECPFCKRAHPTLTQLFEKYAGKVKLVYRDFPLESIHPQARRAAEAARCAQDQGKFWDYYDTLFTESPKLALDDLKRYAAQVGIDVNKFDECLSGGVHKTAVQEDIDEGTRLGVSGTPAFFVNGRPLSGAQPIEAFARIIEEELTRISSLQSK